MFLSASTLDDLLYKAFSKLLASKTRATPTRGSTIELLGVQLRLTNPRARLSHSEMRGKVFSGLGEFLWYLTKSNKLSFIEYYIPHYRKESLDKKTVNGAYGLRLFGQRNLDQVSNVISLLNENPQSRRAVIQLFNAEDVRDSIGKTPETRPEVPCTCSLQFLIRNAKLHLIVHMRSNDAYKGLSHDIFAFTMLQELIARRIGCQLGQYRHVVGSLHLYTPDLPRVQQYIDEGLQPTRDVAMPNMPRANLDASIKRLLRVESKIRRQISVDVEKLGLHQYWADLVRLLQVFGNHKQRKHSRNRSIRSRMASPIYDAYIVARQESPAATPESPQLKLPFTEERDSSQEDIE